MEKKFENYGVEKENKEKKLPAVLNEEDFAKILAETKKPYHRLAFKLAFFSGLRISEIINLQKSDFDRNRRLIFVRRGKGKKDRYVPYPVNFIKQADVEKYIPIKCGVRALEIAFKNKVKKVLGRDDLHFHNLRHSFATNLLSKGIPITEVQFWLGHSRLSTTSIYLKVSPEAALKRYEELWK